jgi:murein DD-endopeptidase MepM/ murein hydrolase activator NlpD
VEYFTQSGDTLDAIAAHFGVKVDDIESEGILDPVLLIDAGTRLLVRDALEGTTPSEILFPDPAVVFSPAAVGFDLGAFADAQVGFLSTYTEMMTRGTTPASEIIAQLALEHSINPRILLALMEVESGWVSGKPVDKDKMSYSFGYIRGNWGGIYRQTGWAIRQLSEGYYGWRAGSLVELTFIDGSTLRMAPSLNAGTAAILNFFAQMHTREEWEALVYGEEGIVITYEALFGDLGEQAAGSEQLYPAGITQPELNLPFPPNEKWNLTGGPHSAWGKFGPRAALDLAPPVGSPGCGNSSHWATAAAAGRVVRVGNGVVVLDLDKDGYEQTGWVLVYMHIANTDHVDLNAYLETDDNIGHPSCEGGNSSGIHVHIARKYNGEWVLADGGLPFVMSGYQAGNGDEPCDYAYWGFCSGTLANDENTVTANPYGHLTAIYRPDSRPEIFYTPTPKS